MKRLLLVSTFVFIIISACSPQNLNAQPKVDNCDKDACRAQAEEAEKVVKATCFTKGAVDNKACLAAFQEWERLIALNCPKKKKTADVEKGLPGNGDTKAKEGGEKPCNSDVPPSPHNANSFNRDYVENVIIPLIESNAFGYIGLGKALLIGAQGYAENSKRFQDSKSAYKPVDGNNIWNLQYPFVKGDPNNRTVPECIDVPKDKYEKLNIDPNNPTALPKGYAMSKNKGFVCHWEDKVINSRTFDSLSAAGAEYMRFVKERYKNGYYEAITDDNKSIRELIDRMAKAHGTEPKYEQRLRDGAAQVMKAVIEYCNQKLTAIDRNIACLAASTNDPKTIKAMEDEKTKYEGIKKAAENLRGILKP